MRRRAGAPPPGGGRPPSVLQLGLRARVRIEVIGVRAAAVGRVAPADAVAAPLAAAAAAPAAVTQARVMAGRNGRRRATADTVLRPAREKTSRSGMKWQDPAIKEHSISAAHVSDRGRVKAPSGQDLELEVVVGGCGESGEQQGVPFFVLVVIEGLPLATLGGCAFGTGLHNLGGDEWKRTSRKEEIKEKSAGGNGIRSEKQGNVGSRNL